MPSFQKRSDQKELLDRPDIPFDAIRKNMQELDVINRYLGGHAITLAGLEEVTQKCSVARPLRITEIGCGGGDNLRAIKRWAQRKGRAVRLCGIDLNPECIRFAREQPENEGIEFQQSDYRDVSFGSLPDVLFSSLFCHHFSDEELVFMLRWMQDHSKTGFFINDLHRHPVAYYSIKGLTQLFSGSYLVKNDAPLSVQRGFTRKEWTAILQKAGISRLKVHWRWAFRWLLTYTHADGTGI
ncbi:MAG TPA: methyltransferase domain-containing protein [Flavisolibacter sp.]|jgi:2-polyprenyl-3-methyl-5-hydroxy-6-metoxy-1,4-benzoquinol methylase|nr:methyltransferase domain-containing protein [Flavisolibacter sp.]